MKKTKKLFALALALMVAFSTLVMPAMAADEDYGIMPLRPVIQCEVCYGSSPRISLTEEKSPSDAYRVNSCPSLNEAHTHVPYRTVEVYQCERCGHKQTYRSGYIYYNCVKDSIYG